jgi:hypothetical protein
MGNTYCPLDHESCTRSNLAGLACRYVPTSPQTALDFWLKFLIFSTKYRPKINFWINNYFGCWLRTELQLFLQSAAIPTVLCAKKVVNQLTSNWVGGNFFYIQKFYVKTFRGLNRGRAKKKKFYAAAAENPWKNGIDLQIDKKGCRKERPPKKASRQSH